MANNRTQNNIAVVTRGDTYGLDITIYTEDNERYILKDNDTVYLGVMDPNQTFEDALLRKRYTKDDADIMGNLVARFEPEDTLDLIPGVYYYAVKLKMDHYDENLEEQVEQVSTIVNRTKFIILE